jgi:predicted nucleic acid-binding protein
MYVIDASVHVADARPQERWHAEARAFLGRAQQGEWTVYVPMIALAEIAAAISRGARQPVLARRLIAALRRVPHFEFVAVDEPLGQLAAELAADHQIRGCDAVYVALARQRGVTLITLDRQQRERVPSDVTARTPQEELGWLAASSGKNSPGRL